MKKRAVSGILVLLFATVVWAATIVINDDFNRPDSPTLGPAWGNYGVSAQIVSQRVRAGALANGIENVYLSTQTSADHSAQITLTTIGGAAFDMGVIARAQPPPTRTFYQCGASQTGTQLVVRIAGTPMVLQADATAWSPGDTIGIGAVGNTITCYRNGSPILSNPDSSIASGYPGARIREDVNLALSEYDNFTATLTVPSAAIVRHSVKVQ